MSKFIMYFPVDTEDVIESLNDLDYDPLLQFVKDLDIRIADLNFSIDMYQYFRDIIKECVDLETCKIIENE